MMKCHHGPFARIIFKKAFNPFSLTAGNGFIPQHLVAADYYEPHPLVVETVCCFLQSGRSVFRESETRSPVNVKVTLLSVVRVVEFMVSGGSNHRHLRCDESCRPVPVTPLIVKSSGSIPAVNQVTRKNHECCFRHRAVSLPDHPRVGRNRP